MMRGPSRQVSVRCALQDVVPARLDVARDVEVEVAVGVRVEERAAGAPAAGGDAGPRRDLGERPVALVAVQEVRPPVRDVEIQPSVVVEVAGARAAAPGGGVHAGLARHVLEPEAAEVAIEDVAVGDSLAGLRQLGGGHEVDVEPAVAVVVEQGETVASRLEDVVLRRAAAVGARLEPGRLRELDGRWTVARDVVGGGDLRGRRAHGRGVAAVDRLLGLRLAVAALEVQAERDLALELGARLLEDRERRGCVEAARSVRRATQRARGLAQLGAQVRPQQRGLRSRGRHRLAAELVEPGGGVGKRAARRVRGRCALRPPSPARPPRAGASGAGRARSPPGSVRPSEPASRPRTPEPKGRSPACRI